MKHLGFRGENRFAALHPPKEITPTSRPVWQEADESNSSDFASECAVTLPCRAVFGSKARELFLALIF